MLDVPCENYLLYGGDCVDKGVDSEYAAVLVLGVHVYGAVGILVHLDLHKDIVAPHQDFGRLGSRHKTVQRHQALENEALKSDPVLMEVLALLAEQEQNGVTKLLHVDCPYHLTYILAPQANLVDELLLGEAVEDRRVVVKNTHDQSLIRNGKNTVVDTCLAIGVLNLLRVEEVKHAHLLDLA